MPERSGILSGCHRLNDATEPLLELLTVLRPRYRRHTIPQNPTKYARMVRKFSDDFSYEEELRPHHTGISK